MGQIIYEMSGLPGSGKSTYLDMVCNEIEWLSKEKKFYSDTYHVRWGSIRTILYMFRGIDSFDDIKFVIKIICDRDVYAHISILKRVGKLFKLKGKIKTNKEYFLISEGLIQCFNEILDNVETKCLQNKQYLWKYFRKNINKYPNLYFIHIIANPKISNNRIQNRIGVSNTVDKLSNEERIKFLKHREISTKYCINVLESTIDKHRFLLIDSMDEIEYNAMLIKDFILSSERGERV